MAVIVDLPTPPLPEATQITFFTWASAPAGSLPRPSVCCRCRFLLVGEDVEADGDLGYPVQLGDLFGDGLFEVGADRAAGGGQRDDDLDPAVVADLDRANHAQLDDRAPQLGIDHGAQLLGYLILRRK